MDQETAERLLAGLVADSSDGARPVAGLLAAVRAAPRASELAGEESVVRAYRLVRAGTPPVLPGRGRPALAGFGVRAGLAGAALALTSGVAIAATVGAPSHPLRAPAPTTPVPAPTADAFRTATPDRPSTPAGGVDGRVGPDVTVTPGPHDSPAGRAGVDPTGRPGAGATGQPPGLGVTGQPPGAGATEKPPGSGATGRPGADPTGRPGAGATDRRPSASPSASETPTRPSRPGPADVPPVLRPPTETPPGVDAG
ncbi:hypothetical protein ACGFIG_23690 [Micromonospora sp. NPDC049048]|uniref:hypothetical protein n=1 Tax=Micromonospora sp. NPDC049048 TaxID=3364263 RepID=UPI003713B82B